MKVKSIIAGLGIGFSCLYGSIFSSSNIIKKQELNLQDSLVSWRSSFIQPHPDITLVNLDKEQDLSEFLESRRNFYVSFVSSLLEQEAAVVVLNLPYEWQKPEKRDGIEAQNNPKPNTLNSLFWDLIAKHHEKIILVAPSHQVSETNILDISPNNQIDNTIINYSHLIASPANLDNEELALSQIQAFFTYEDREAINPSNNQTIGRKFISQAFFDTNNSEKSMTEDATEPNELKSFAWLTLEKYQKNSLNKNNFKIPLSLKKINSNFWQPHETFKTLTLSEICQNNNIWDRQNSNCSLDGNSQIREHIYNKIVIVGFNSGDKLDVLSIKSPFRERKDFLFKQLKIPMGNKIKIPATEVQANVISSLMTNSYYQTLPKLGEVVIYILGGAIICIMMTSCNTSQCLKYLGLGMVGGYGSLSVIAFFSGWMLPIISPMLTWIAVTISVAAYLKNIQLIRDNERKQLQIAEETAIISQADKLIRRIWSDIHDDPLQELKVAMDDVELLDIPESESEAILDRLSYVGAKIRQYLDINPTAKFVIQPELRQGLAFAIEQHLKQLINSGKLQLKVVTNLQTINQPQFNSSWIDAREDIFRFFREAMTNVVRHAQGENSTATQVLVTLSQEAQQCTLLIENDGGVLNTVKDIKKKGGMGTKLMAEIAKSLPDGDWSRIALTDGGMRVQLQWQHDFK